MKGWSKYGVPLLIWGLGTWFIAYRSALISLGVGWVILGSMAYLCVVLMVAWSVREDGWTVTNVLGYIPFLLGGAPILFLVGASFVIETNRTGESREELIDSGDYRVEQGEPGFVRVERTEMVDTPEGPKEIVAESYTMSVGRYEELLRREAEGVESSE